MRKILISACFFFLTPALLIVSILFFGYLSSYSERSFLSFQKSPKVAYAAVPNSNQAYLLDNAEKDARVERIRDFLTKYDSDLAPYAEFIVETADKYSLDWRLVPVIAMQESTLCKKAPKDSFNCWGFGIYGKKVTKFSNYKEAIETVTKTLAKNYIDQGLVEPDEIMSKYTPSNDGTWAKNVASLMNGLQI
ncbi:MAG: hypothetical protein A2798_02675 [Candidatus Levybacteria bacterium RIFCSPHIGHO2_01_FULL_37_17]|nr:MAG: hypothetical protein A2798_02675 [Candidatus Levybacteria bacterium RIFCSPHIGHO2_01_FULL_37_17]OGH36762.1 MAG: hypothetical protein A2959_00665 [Candidatus Levybacteria bacterium RIFCSPLOWO2_01_FULL_38_23]